MYRVKTLSWRCATVFTLAIPVVLFAAGKPNFSGKWLAKFQGVDHKAQIGALIVNQTGDTIKITRVETGQSAANEYPLNGKSTQCRDLAGQTGTGRVRVRGRQLRVECHITSAAVSAIRMYEQWDLSADGNVLTINFQTTTGSVGEAASSFRYTLKYARDTRPNVRYGQPLTPQ